MDEFEMDSFFYLDLDSEVSESEAEWKPEKGSVVIPFEMDSLLTSSNILLFLVTNMVLFFIYLLYQQKNFIEM